MRARGTDHRLLLCTMHATANIRSQRHAALAFTVLGVADYTLLTLSFFFKKRKE